MSESGDKLLKLDADVLLLSAERVKEALRWELDYPTERASKIRIVLYPASKSDEIIGVIASYSPGQWEYRVEIPDQIDPQKLVRGLVHALLLEVANRGQGPRSAELPLWLVEGLTFHLLSIGGTDLVVGSVPLGSMLRIVRERRGLDYLQPARELLRANAPLTFSQLAYPSSRQLQADKLKVFQASAQLLVCELLRCRHGADNLITLLRELPKCWNWETALLRGFASEFGRMLDVEKKWSVDVLAFTARDPSQIWARVVCLDRLDQILTVPSQVRVTPEILPVKKTLALQEVIAHWDLASQVPVFRQKLALLEILRFHADADIASLIDDYYRAIATYLQKRDSAARSPETRMQTAPSASAVVQGTRKDLGSLDKRRAALRPENSLSANSR